MIQNPIQSNKKFKILNTLKKHSTKEIWNYINLNIQLEISRIKVFKKEK